MSYKDGSIIGVNPGQNYSVSGKKGNIVSSIIGLGTGAMLLIILLTAEKDRKKLESKWQGEWKNIKKSGKSKEIFSKGLKGSRWEVL